jgi:glycosyltransferase involved in cell wall biosynthesis
MEKERSRRLWISIVIATLNRHPLLNTCLDSLERALSNASWVACEVIIVDQTEILFRPSKAYSFPIRIVGSPKGASRARNIGLLNATGDYVWFLDDDAEVVKFLPFSPKQLDRDSMLFAQWLERPCPTKPFLDGRLWSKLWLIRNSGTPFYLLPRSLATKAGGFDEDLGPGRAIAAGEDLDLLLRAYTKAIHKQANIFIAILSHSISPKSPSKKRSYATARGYVLAKNAWYIPLAVELAYSMLAVLRGDLKRILWVLRGCWSYFRQHK